MRLTSSFFLGLTIWSALAVHAAPMPATGGKSQVSKSGSAPVRGPALASQPVKNSKVHAGAVAVQQAKGAGTATRPVLSSETKAASGSTGQAAKSKSGTAVNNQNAGISGQANIGTSHAAQVGASSKKASTSDSSAPVDAGAKTSEPSKDEQTPAACSTHTTCESCAGQPDPSRRNKKCNFFVPREGPKFGTGVCISGSRPNGILTSYKKQCSKIEDEKKSRLDASKKLAGPSKPSSAEINRKRKIDDILRAAEGHIFGFQLGSAASSGRHLSSSWTKTVSDEKITNIAKATKAKEQDQTIVNKEAMLAALDISSLGQRTTIKTVWIDDEDTFLLTAETQRYTKNKIKDMCRQAISLMVEQLGGAELTSSTKFSFVVPGIKEGSNVCVTVMAATCFPRAVEPDSRAIGSDCSI